MIFKAYTNRYGKKLILEESILGNFHDLKDGLSAVGIDIEMTDAWRGEKDQDHAKETGHSNASWGLSPHNYGVAFDCAPIINGRLEWPSDMTIWGEIGKTGTALGMTWGGNFHSITDLPHFEMTGWRDMGLTLYPQEPPVAA